MGNLAAQDNSNFAHYFMNPYSINPSFAGTDGRPSLFLTYRRQWINIEGAPSVGNVSFQAPIGKRLGFGLNVTNAERGILNTSSVFLSNSVSISLSDLMTLRFGASIGAANNSVNVDELANVPASTLAEALDQNTYLLGNAGLSLQVKYFNFGVSIPNLFADEFISKKDFTVGEVTPLENLLIFASNRFYLSGQRKHMIEPYLLYRYSDVLPPQIEGSLVVTLNHTVWFGGSYKQDFGISALGGVKFNKVFGLGYSYSIQNTGDNEVNSPSHEIQLNILFGGRKKDRFVYSFVDSELPKVKSKRQLAIEEHNKKIHEEQKLKHEAAVKKAAEEKEKLEAEKRLEEEAARKTISEAVTPKEDKAIVEPVKTEKLSQETKSAIEEKVDQTNAEELPLKDDVKAEAEGQTEEQEVIRVAEEEKVNSSEKEAALPVEQTKIVPNETIRNTPKVVTNENLVEKYSTEERVIVKRGGHLLEIPKGEYVVVGVFGSYEHAEKFSDNLFFRGYQSKFGYISQEGYWYVYVYDSSDIEDARRQRDQLRQKQVFTNAWVLSVQ